MLAYRAIWTRQCTSLEEAGQLLPEKVKGYVSNCTDQPKVILPRINATVPTGECTAPKY
jgi:hypothetical protein